jgi:hypothetical protein
MGDRDNDSWVPYPEYFGLKLTKSGAIYIAAVRKGIMSPGEHPRDILFLLDEHGPDWYHFRDCDATLLNQMLWDVCADPNNEDPNGYVKFQEIEWSDIEQLMKDGLIDLKTEELTDGS